MWLYTKLSERLSYIYVVCCAVFAAIFATALLNYLLTKPIAPVLDSVHASTSNVSAQGQQSIAVIERNLFGIETVRMLPGMTMTAMSPEGVNWRLTGVLMSQNARNSRAIVVLSDGSVNILSPQKEVNGMRLKSATSNSIVFSYDGQDYMLELEASSQSLAARPPANTANPAPANTSVVRMDENHYSVARSEVNERLQDINAVLRSMLVTPLYDGEAFMGYRISRMEENAPLTLLGLQRGDVINRLNGEELTNPQALFDMLGKVNEIDALSVDVTRNGEKKTIFVEIQ